jgi:MFS family permease
MNFKEVKLVAKSVPSNFVQIAIFGCFMNFATRGIVAVYETMGTVIATSSTMNWSSLSVGVLVSCSGIIGVIILLDFKRISQKFNDFQIMIFGIFIMLLSCGMFMFPVSTEENGDIQFSLCFSVMYSVAYPVGNTAVLAMFSKIIDEGPQGQFLGWFASAGSASRIIFPITAGVLSVFYGDFYIFLICTAMISLSIAISLYFRRDIYSMLGIVFDPGSCC